MIYQANGLLPNQTVIDFTKTTERIFSGTEAVLCYSSPFSFYLSGNTNLYGYRIEIYRNDNNLLVYDSGDILEALITSADENESTLSPYTEEYKIYPCNTDKYGSSNLKKPIDIPPILPSGDNVRINAYLNATATFNNLNATVDPEYNNRSYNWVLKQYYSKNFDGSVDTSRYVRNTNTFFVAKEQLFVGVRVFTYDEYDNIVVQDNLQDVKERELYFEGRLLSYNEGTGYILNNPSNYEIMATRWLVELINITDSSQNEIYKDTGWVVTSSLNFSYDGFLKLNDDSLFYRVSLYVKYKYGGEDYSSAVGQILKNNSIKEGNLIIKPTYGVTDISQLIQITGEVCQKENYIKLNWDAVGITGRYYENGERLSGKELNSKFINATLPYDATDDAVNNSIPRELTAVYIQNYEGNLGLKKESLTYSSEFLRNFKINYNTQQIVLRVCNFSNTYTTVPQSINGVTLVQDSVPNGVILKIYNANNSYSYYRLLAIKEQENYYYALQYVVNGEQKGYWDTKINNIPTTNASSQYWTTLCLNLADDIENIQGNYNKNRITVLENLYCSMIPGYEDYSVTTNFGFKNSFKDITLPSEFAKIQNPNSGISKNGDDSYATSGLPYLYSEEFNKVPHHIIEVQGLIDTLSVSAPKEGKYINTQSLDLYSYKNNSWERIRALSAATIDEQGDEVANEDICYVWPASKLNVSYKTDGSIVDVTIDDEEKFKDVVEEFGEYTFTYAKQGSAVGWKINSSAELISTEVLLETYGINCHIKENYEPEPNIDFIVVGYDEAYRFYTFTNGALYQVINYVTPLWNEKLNIPYIVTQDTVGTWKSWSSDSINVNGILPFATVNKEEMPVYDSITLYNGLFNYLGILNLGEKLVEDIYNNADLLEYYKITTSDTYAKILYRVLGKELLPIYKTEINGKENTHGSPALYYLPGSYMLAHFFDRTLQGLDLTMGGEPIEYWEVERVDNLTNTKIKAAKVESSYNTLIDYLVPNNWEGYYSFSAITKTKKGAPIIVGGKNTGGSLPIDLKTNWWNYSLIILSEPDFTGTRTVEDVFYWEHNANTDSMNNNTSYSIQETLSQFKRITKSNTDAMSGSLQSLMGCLSNGVYIKDSVEIMDKLRSAQMSNKVKVLKDRSGKNYVIEFTSPITYTYDNKVAINSFYENKNRQKNIVIQPTSIKINWIEVDKIENITGVKLI